MSSIIVKEDQKNIIMDWLLENYKLPIEVCFVVHKKRSGWRGIIKINEAPCLGFRFQLNEVNFYPLSCFSVGLQYDEWCRIWLYDTRVQASVAFLIDCIKKHDEP